MLLGITLARQRKSAFLEFSLSRNGLEANSALTAAAVLAKER
jgi:hypothetical protein